MLVCSGEYWNPDHACSLAILARKKPWWSTCQLIVQAICTSRCTRCAGNSWNMLKLCKSPTTLPSLVTTWDWPEDRTGYSKPRCQENDWVKVRPYISSNFTHVQRSWPFACNSTCVHCVNISVNHIEPMGSSRRLGVANSHRISRPTDHTLQTHANSTHFGAFFFLHGRNTDCLFETVLLIPDKGDIDAGGFFDWQLIPSCKKSLKALKWFATPASMRWVKSFWQFHMWTPPLLLTGLLFGRSALVSMNTCGLPMGDVCNSSLYSESEASFTGNIYL